MKCDFLFQTPRKRFSILREHAGQFRLRFLFARSKGEYCRKGVRRAGGIYFLPVRHKPVMQALKSGAPPPHLVKTSTTPLHPRRGSTARPAADRCAPGGAGVTMTRAAPGRACRALHFDLMGRGDAAGGQSTHP
jgi:hypothetical protein